MRRLPEVRWGQPPLGFALETSDEGVLARAAMVLGAWPLRARGTPSEVWCVDSDVSAGASRWRVSARGSPDVFSVTSVPEAVRTVEFLAVQLLFDFPSACTLHGALVARSGRGVLLLGRGEAGKSTLGCALWQRGWTLLGDDMALVDPGAGCAWAAPRRVLLRKGSRALVGQGLWERLISTSAGELTSEGCLFDPRDLDGSERSAAVPLAGLVFLGRAESEGTRGARRLEPAHALLALLPYANLARRMAAGDVIRRLRPLVETVPACDLARGPLDEMIAAVEAFAQVPG